jgi:hypothetical protein
MRNHQRQADLQQHVLVDAADQRWNIDGYRVQLYARSEQRPNTDGDPLEIQTRISLVFIAGKPVNLETDEKRLSDKYLKPQ